MATTSFTVLRRLAGAAFVLMLFSLCLLGAAIGQAPPVTATSPAGLVHSAPTAWSTIEDTAIDANGDWLVGEYPHGGLFEFPANGGPMITLVPLGGLGEAGTGEGYWKSSIVLDPDQNLFVGGGYGNCELVFPYGSAASPWPLLAQTLGLGPSASVPSPYTATVAANVAVDYCAYDISNYNYVNPPTPPSFAEAGYYLPSSWASSPGYFQPWATAIGQGTYANQLVIGTANSPYIFTIPVSGAWSDPVADCSNGSLCPSTTTGSLLLSGASERFISIAVDVWGNVYFVEDSGGIPGVYEIPSGTTGLTSDCPAYANGSTQPATGSSCLTRVDNNLPNVKGVVSDASGNLYVSDGTDGVFMIPAASGAGLTPNTQAQTLLSPVPAQGEVAIDPVRKILYVPTTQTQSAALTTTAPYALEASTQADVAKVGVNYAEFGAAPVGTTTPASLPVDFSFNSTEVVDRSIVMENGQSSNDFAISSSTCTAQGTYNAGQSCTVNVTMTPHFVGNLSAELLLQSSSGVASNAPNYSDSITGFQPSGGTLTLVVNNTLFAGEEFEIVDTTPTDCLYPLNGSEFNVLTASATQVTVSESYSAPQSCTANSQGVYSTSATLTAKVYTTIAAMELHGTGLGALGQVAAGVESTIGNSLHTPAQMTVDGNGNLYVADPGSKQVLMYPSGSTTTTAPVSVGSNLQSPTGVAVDGTGDVFIADSGAGTVYELPVALPGLNSSSQQSQIALLTGLGTTGLSVAVDGLGDLYVADPTNQHVVKLSGITASGLGALAQSTTYLTTGAASPQPTAVAVDSNNNLYVLDSGNLYEFTGGVGTATVVLNGLSGVTNVAIDPSGAIYLASASGTIRVPVVNGVVGTLSQIAPDVTSASSVALDRWANVYIALTNGPGVRVLSTTGTLTLPEPTTLTGAGSSTSAPTIVTNAGNASLSVTGYSNSMVDDYSVSVASFSGADGSCEADSPVAAGDTCQMLVTFDPGAGQQNLVTGWVEATSNAINAPITVDTTATGLPLAGSQTKFVVASGPQVINTSLTVTVTAASGNGVPTGTVQVSYPTWTVTPTGTINYVTATAALPLSNGQAVFPNLAPVAAGADQFTVGYSGDRTYGESTQTQTVNVAKSAISGFTGDQNPPSFLPFVEEANPPSSLSPYDGSQAHWEYSMPVTINTAAGIPTGTITFMDNSSTCPPGTSPTGVGAAYCLLANYSGQACPQAPTSGIQTVLNNGSSNTGASASFTTDCLQMPEFTTYTPVVSTHYITPVYSGDANFLAATDSVSSLFQALSGPLVTINTSIPGPPGAPVSAATLTVQSGSSASLTFYLTPLLGYAFQGKNATQPDFNFPVSLACDNLPPHAQCTFSYPSVVSPYQPTAPNSAQICPQPNLTSNADTAAQFEELAEDGGCNANGVGVVTLTITTSVTVGTTTTSQNASTASITLASLFGLGMIGLFVRRKAFEKAHRLMMVLLMVVAGALAVTLSACNTSNLSPLAQITTPPGTYAVNITATQVGSQCVASSSPKLLCTTGTGQQGTIVNGSNNQVSLPYYINLTVQ